ncbi:MAG: iron ABC transporter permease [Nostocaceae cyanobacterium]|nr:iron ABC transporter permease [Nostocaceae cyanobacterium]
MLPRTRLIIGLAVGFFLLLVCLFISVSFGAADIPGRTIFQALVNFDDGSREQLIIRTIRLPRSLLAMLVGAGISTAGAIMQGITRNPLADPGILGINAGAIFAVVISIFLFHASAPSFYIWCGLIGAGITVILVYFLAYLGRGGITPLNLTIAGAAIGALLGSLTTTVLIVNQRALAEVRFWLAGSLANAEFSTITQVLPYICVGMIVAIAISKQITILSLGEDVAKGLGQQTGWVKILAGLSVLCLDGSAVAVGGAIGFLGLIVPHMVRFFVGVNYQWILPYSALFGAILLLVSDLIARLIIQPQEVPVGIMTAIVGAPFFIYVAKTQVKKSTTHR